MVFPGNSIEFRVQDLGFRFLDLSLSFGRLCGSGKLSSFKDSVSWELCRV